MSLSLFRILLMINFAIYLINAKAVDTVNETNSKDEIKISEIEKDNNASVHSNEIKNEFENNFSKDENQIDEDRAYREQYAKKMISIMNESVDPCDDFYEYACGNFKNTLSKRNTRKRRVNLLERNFDLNNMVEDLLENPNEQLKQKYATELEQAQIFYKSCLETNLQKLPKSEIYLHIIKNISGFPASDETWQPEKFDWFRANAELSHYGINVFTNEKIVPQYPFPPYFKLIELGFDEIIRNDSVNNQTTRGYKENEQIMREYLTTYGVVEPKVTQVINSIFELWHAILNITDEFNNSAVKCRELGISKNITQWEEFEIYFEIAWNGLEHVYEVSNCPCPYFYAKLDEICNERKQAVANYLALKFLYHMDARLLDAAFQKEFCDERTKNSFRLLIDQFYMEKYFHGKNYDELVWMTKEIRSSLREKLLCVDWLDDDTREEALLKESTIKFRIGRFEDSEFMDKLIAEIQNLSLIQTNYEKNNVDIAKFKQSMKRYNGLHYKQLSEDTKPLEMLTGMQVQGFYFNVDNSINMMVGLLQPPAYHKSWPLALKFGTIGFLLGHELIHAFDTTGAGFDSNGNERLWWTEESIALFENLTQCYIEMFNNYEIPEINRNINGDLTNGENIADHGGLRHAFKAYEDHMKKLKVGKDYSEEISITKNEHMPGLDMTPEQLFYLGFAQLWCSNFTKENYFQELKDYHTIDKYRVLGAVSNTEKFATAYNCAVGSKMNPSSKCKFLFKNQNFFYNLF